MKQPQLQQPNMNLKVDPRTLPSLSCDECKGEAFEIVYLLKKVSPIISGQPRVQYMPIDMFACKKCGHVNNDLHPFKQIEVAKKDEASGIPTEPGKLIVE